MLSSASGSGASCVLEAHRVYPDDNGKEEVCILVAHVGPHFAHSNNLISVFLRFSLFFWVLFSMLAPSSLLFTYSCSPWLHPYFILSGSPMTSMATSQPSFYSFLSIVFGTGSHSLSRLLKYLRLPLHLWLLPSIYLLNLLPLTGI